MEYVSCDLCGANENELVYAVSGMNVVRCLKCGLAYTNPRLSREERKKLYSEEFFKTGGFDYIQNKEVAYADAQMRVKEIMKFKTAGKILEVGCALGIFLDVATKYGWETYGVEISEWAANYARTQLGLKVITGEIEDNLFPDNYFDVVVMFHLLEHTESPRVTLQKVSKLLKPTGLLVITVPDINSSNARRTKELWTTLKPIEHLYHFSLNSLTDLLKQTGFNIITTKKFGGTGLLGNKSTDASKGIISKFDIKNSVIFGILRKISKVILVNLLNRYDYITVYARKR